MFSAQSICIYPLWFPAVDTAGTRVCMYEVAIVYVQALFDTINSTTYAMQPYLMGGVGVY